MIYEFENNIGNKEKWKLRKHHKKRCAEGSFYTTLSKIII
jgi:hypothetical protein